MCILGGGEAVTIASSRVREAYESWCRAEGEAPVSPKALTTQLVAKFCITKVKGSRGVRLLSGITLVGSATDDVPHAEPSDPWSES
jgi:putative DNA primase/helicase